MDDIAGVWAALRLSVQTVSSRNLFFRNGFRDSDGISSRLLRRIACSPKAPGLAARGWQRSGSAAVATVGTRKVPARFTDRRGRTECQRLATGQSRFTEEQLDEELEQAIRMIHFGDTVDGVGEMEAIIRGLQESTSQSAILVHACYNAAVAKLVAGDGQRAA